MSKSKKSNQRPRRAGNEGQGRSRGNDSVFEQLKRAQEKRQAAPQTPAATPEAPAAAPQAPEAEKPTLRPSEEPSAAPKSEAAPATTQSPPPRRA